jgi:CheY-like chemotaxis protein
MRLEQMTTTHVRRAMSVYLHQAWPTGAEGEAKRILEGLEGLDRLDRILEGFEKVGGKGEELRRYALRLGNARYPFMKFVVQEHIVDGEFFFSVDSHDNFEVVQGAPDYEEWQELKGFNRRLKREIEAEWLEVGLPTNILLRALMEELARVEREEEKRQRILLVDDEQEVAEGLAALLRARGYDVELARDGMVALERLREDPLPDIVVLDYEMPRLDGEEVLRCLRGEERTAGLPVLLATASSIDLGRMRQASGLLRKPYPRHVLFEMIARLLGS